MQNSKRSIFLFLKGMAMGAADVVPGVSGGTIAFISGIYEELVSSIDGVNLGLLKVLKQEGFASFWKKANGNFLLTLLSGIAVSVFSLANAISFLLKEHPILVWSFFFGLVLSSVFVILKSISKFSLVGVVIALVMTAVAYYITLLEPMSDGVASPMLFFFSGALAICAMILPGISGSFILVIIGSYQVVLEAVDSFEFKSIFLFLSGAVVGILSFAKILKWLFKNFRDITLLGLSGFIVGSLNKVWPWKDVLEWRTDRHGEQVALIEKSILPINFDGDPKIALALIAAAVGFILIFVMERFANSKS
jgi:putative membrane protein